MVYTMVRALTDLDPRQVSRHCEMARWICDPWTRLQWRTVYRAYDLANYAAAHRSAAARSRRSSSAVRRGP